VVLGTLSSRVDPDAEEMAIASAIEAGVPLLVVNAVPMPACRHALAVASRNGLSFPVEEDYEQVRATAERAASFGLRVEHVSSPRPPKALVQVANERGAGLVVLGPERGHVSRWRFRRAAREIKRNAACLIWIAGE
jgi:nucleotide-binding universal stress UspA family protein